MYLPFFPIDKADNYGFELLEKRVLSKSDREKPWIIKLRVSVFSP